MKKIQKTPFAIAMSASLLPFAANAAESNPFALSDLATGYMQTAEAEASGDAKGMEGKCGEGKCGGSMMEQSTDSKAMEGKCAGNKPAPAPSGDKKSDEKK